jgi:hypothetical protein
VRRARTGRATASHTHIAEADRHQIGKVLTPVRASVARPLVEGLRNPTVARDERVKAVLPRELTPFDVAAREALGSM